LQAARTGSADPLNTAGAASGCRRTIEGKAQTEALAYICAGKNIPAKQAELHLEGILYPRNSDFKSARVFWSLGESGAISTLLRMLIPRKQT